MKVNGKQIKGPRVETLVLPYGENGDDFIVFKFRALTSKDDFEKVMPRPKPKKKMLPGNQEHYETESPEYKEAIAAWAQKKLDWEFLQSISITEGLEWKSVDMSKPETWKNWRDDFEEFFGVIEFNRLYNSYLRANVLSDDQLEEARNRFLASQVLGQSAS